MVDPNGMQWTSSANPEPPNMAIPFFTLSPSQSSKIKLDINGSNALSSIKNFGSYKSAEDFWNAVAKIWVDLKDKSAFIQNNGNGSFSVAFYKSGAGLNSSYDRILSSGASYVGSDAFGTQFWKSGKENGIIHNPFSTFKGYGQNLNYKEEESNDDLSGFDKMAFLYENGTMIPSLAFGFAGTKAGKISAIGGSYVWKSSTYSTQKALLQQAAIGSKLIKTINLGNNILTAGFTIADGVTNGFEAHHFADLGIQAVIYGISASVPVFGWVLGGAYFVGDLYFQSTHDGKSITEYYLDN